MAAICDGPVTKELLQKILQEFFKTEATLEKCEGVVISKGMGFTSEVIRVQLEWNNLHKDGFPVKEENLPKKVIVKAPMTKCLDFVMKNMCSEEQLMESASMSTENMVQMIHKAECEAYKVLCQVNPHPVPIPLIYGIRENDPGVIVMEDLADRANIIDNLATGLNLSQWRSITVHLAHLHAWSLTTDVNWRATVLGPEAMLPMFKSFVEMTQKGLKSTKEKYHDYFGHIDESLFEKEITFESFAGSFQRYQKYVPDVMVHGDTWINNIMFLRDSKNPNQLTDKVAAFIDWQISAVGCGLYDLARLTCWCVPQKLRRSHVDEILKLYFDEFRSKAGGVLAESVTFEGIKKVFLHSMAMHGLFGIPMTDFMLTFVVKVHEDSTGLRQSEFLGRMKAMYDEAAEYFKYRNENSIEGL